MLAVLTRTPIEKVEYDTLQFHDDLKQQLDVHSKQFADHVDASKREGESLRGSLAKAVEGCDNLATAFRAHVQGSQAQAASIHREFARQGQATHNAIQEVRRENAEAREALYKQAQAVERLKRDHAAAVGSVQDLGARVQTLERQQVDGPIAVALADHADRLDQHDAEHDHAIARLDRLEECTAERMNTTVLCVKKSEALAIQNEALERFQAATADELAAISKALATLQQQHQALLQRQVARETAAASAWYNRLVHLYNRLQPWRRRIA
jgi:chromosome segregation ATPase